jgi:VWFA-related protein
LLKNLIISLLIAQLSTGALLAQQNSGEQQKLVETVDIRVINIDVVVTDRRGNPIKGLTADDFELVENGRAQKITNFYEVSVDDLGTVMPENEQQAAELAEARPANLHRRFIFFVDNLSLHPMNRNRVFQSMKEFARTSMLPGDQAMIATWNRSLKVRLPFTSDAVQIQQTLDAIAGESGLGVAHMSERRSTETNIREARTAEEAIGFARSYAQSVEHDLRTTVSHINSLMATLAGVEGKKVMVLTSEGFHIQPGREMFTYVEEMRKERSHWQRSNISLLESTHFDSAALIQTVARTANANNIAIYTLHAGGLTGVNEGSAENAAPIPFTVQQAALSNSTESLGLLANMTGGRATIGTNNFRDAFGRIERDLASYYSLGYRSTTERVDRQREITVRPKDRKNRGWVIQARKTFVEKSVATEMTDRVIANLFHARPSNDLGIVAVTGRPVQIDVDRFRVPLEVRIPMSSINFLPQGELNMGGFEVFIVVANSLGDMSEVSRQQQRVTLRPEDAGELDGKHYTYAVELIMEKGRNKISIGVVDELSNSTGFEQREILAMDLR